MLADMGQISASVFLIFMVHSLSSRARGARVPSTKWQRQRLWTRTTVLYYAYVRRAVKNEYQRRIAVLLVLRGAMKPLWGATQPPHRALPRASRGPRPWGC